MKNSFPFVGDILFAIAIAFVLMSIPRTGLGTERGENQQKYRFESLVVYPPEAVNVSDALTDSITIALVTELESQRLMVHDYRPVFEALAEKNQESNRNRPFKLTLDVKKEIANKLGCGHFIDGRLFRLGEELRFSAALRDAKGNLIVGRSMSLGDESDLPVVIPRLVESLLTGKRVDETLTLDNATKHETKSKANRIDLEVYPGLQFGVAAGIKAMHSYPVFGFDCRFELKQVMIQFNLGLGVNGNATSGDAAVIMHYYLLSSSISPYLGVGGGVFVGDKWAEEGEDTSGTAKFFGGQFFPQVGVEFLRAASIRVHVDVKYAVNVSDDRWGHGPVALVGIGF
jgi:hypothetical protein